MRRLLLLLAALLPAAADQRQQIEAAVMDMYSAHPFPHPDAVPADRVGHTPPREGFIGPSYVAEVTHHVFGGRADWLARAPRVLLAGGGTGMMTLPFALELQRRAPGARVTFLDLTPASLAEARRRWEAAGVRIATFVQGSLLDPVPGGPYAYIDCTGVLHHTPDPPAALARLSAALEPLGGMGVMVYGAVGRAPVYHMRRMLAELPPAADRGAALDRLWALLGELPDANPVAAAVPAEDRAPGARSAQADTAMSDTFLHPQDVAYDVRGVHALAAGAGLRVASFLRHGEYEPVALVQNATLARELAALPLVDRQAFAELFACTASLHEFYAVRRDNPVQAPVLTRATDRVVARFGSATAVTAIEKLRATDAPTAALKLRGGVLGFVGEPELASNIILLVEQARGTDKSLGDLWREARAGYEAAGAAPPTWPDFLAAARLVVGAYNSVGQMFIELG